jgi:hypothetical protein
MEVAADNQHYTSTVNGIACNAILSKDGLTLLNGCMNSVVPAGVTSIAARAFDDCDGLTSITLPESVTSIAARAFEDCDGFTSLTLPTSVTSIGEGAFSYCKNLKSFIIPANVTSIEDDAFFRCDNLKDVYCWANPNNLKWNDNNCNDFIVIYSYSNSYKQTSCHVPAEYLSIYERNWSTSETGGEGTDVNVNFVGDLVVLEDKAANTFTTSSDIQVVLSGRTLYRDGYWNTICLPFDLYIEGSVLDGATVKTLTDATLTDGTLTLNFADATDANDKDCDEDTDEFYMEAGKPYIIRWGTPEDPSTDLINPVFEYVDITAAEPSSVVCKDENDKTVITFQGLYDCRNFTATDKSILYLGSNNTLYYPKPAEGSTMTIGAFRALFQLGEGITAGEPSAASQIKAFVMNFGNEGNGISEIHADPSSDAGWYTIDGRRLLEEPKDRGMYIFKGRKVMIK